MIAVLQRIFNASVIADGIDPVLFYNSPFYYETGTLAAHCDGARDFRGHRSAAGFTYWKNEHLFEDQDSELWQLVKRQKKEKMYLICGPYNDTSQHFCFNYRPVFAGGLKSIYESAVAKLENATDGERDFLISVCEGLLSIKKISEKFAEKAEKMAESQPGLKDMTENSSLTEVCFTVISTADWPK